MDLWRNVVGRMTDGNASNGLTPTQDATTATSYIIDNFGMRDLFGRENYEYYARLTGRILKVTFNFVFEPTQVAQKPGGR